MKTFQANLGTLPPPQLRLWPELDGTPEYFTLYGGTALALRLGHRASVDFDFFTNQTFNPDQIARTIPYLKEAERVQVAPNTLTCRLDRDGLILVSFFGGLGLGLVAPPEQVSGRKFHVASLLDLAGTKAAVIQTRAEIKDYIDIAALLEQGIDLPTILGAGRVVYGQSFNPLITLKALSYFGDVPELPLTTQTILLDAANTIDLSKIPDFIPYKEWDENQ